ncbi:CHAT domain-containing protein [Aquimarina megaterium]|uniref:CHAT domain-containing protein n=1 Tax=Aquimarina megaterium TaxID=1443666 RepID=UPI000944126F|nr:CHAT domain-containing tetratricopeptide repeat protein [Aquimarina megaterium]
MQKIQLTFSVFLFWITFFTILSYSTYAQVTNDTLIASQYFKKADSLLIDKKYDSSIEFFSKALPIYKNAKTWERLAACYNGISENQWRNYKLDKSLANAKKALKTSNTYLTKDNKEEAYAYDNMGNYYEGKLNFKKALAYYQKALIIRRKIFPEKHVDIALSYANLGLNYYYISEYEKALKHHEKALLIRIKILGAEHYKTGNSYNNIGMVYGRLGKYEKAIEYYKKDLKTILKNFGTNDSALGPYYINIGISYYYLLQYDNALNSFFKTIPIFTQKNKLFELSLIYNNIGVIYNKKGEYDKAIQYYNKSIEINLKINGEDHVNIADNYMNVGILFHSKKDYKKALLYYKKALPIYKTIHRENSDDMGNIYKNIGDSYTSQKKYELALIYYEKVLKIRKKIFNKENLKISDIYLGIAQLYLEKEIHTSALQYSKKSLNILQNLYGENHFHTIQSQNQIATIHKRQQVYKKAINHFDNALLANTINKGSEKYDNTFNPNRYYDLHKLLETLTGKAKTLQLQYLEDQDLKHLDQSIAIYKNVDMIIDQIRQSYQNYQDKVTFAKQVKEVSQDAIAAYLLLYASKKDEQWLEKALYYVEKSKANILMELLNDSHAKNFAGLPSEIIEMGKTLKTNRAFYQSQIIDELSKTSSDSTKIKDYENELFNLERTQDSLTQILEKNYPKYHQLKYKNDIVSVSDIQQQLDDTTTLLEFFTGDSITYAFSISKHDISVQELSTPKLTEQIETFRKSIIAKNTGAYKQQAYALYNTLIAPVKDKLVGDQLIVIPDGPLWHLNFELLLTQKDDSNNPALLSYLLKKYAITYANSANLLFTTFKSDQKTKPLQECLAFSFSDSTKIADTYMMSLATLRSAGDDLPGTRKEIKAISDIIDGQYYFGSQAIEANFKSNAGQYNILHLALHGEVDNERPENSKLYFTKSKDTIEDNLLYSHELFALDIPAELTVLSACNTGSGKIAKGEGIMSLGTAFQYAGTKSLLLTSWEVSDQTTPELMKYFYTNLKAGMHKGKALQQAKLQYLSTANINRTDPFYWGGFYLVGDTTAMQFNNNTQLYWILGLGAVAAILLVVFLYRRRIKKQ